MLAGSADPYKILAAVWQRPAMLDALQARDMGQVFRLVRQYAGMSQTAIGIATGLSQGKVSEIMKGAVQVSKLEVYERIADGLHMSDAARTVLGLACHTSHEPAPLLTRSPTPVSIPSWDGIPASLRLSVESDGFDSLRCDPASVDLMTLAWVVGRLDARMDRRTMLLLAAGMTAEAAVGISDPWERFSKALTGQGRLDEDAIERLEARTVGFHRLEFGLPARAIYQGLTTHINEISTLLQSGVPESYRRRLAITAGEAATLAAWTAWDLGQSNQATSFERLAALAAKESGHRVIQACAYAYQAYTVSGRDAYEQIQHAKEFLPTRGEDATRAWLLYREAEEVAALGDRRSLDVLQQAEEVYTRARPHREHAWTRFLDVGRVAAFRLSIYVGLGDERRVTEAGQEALSAVASDSEGKRVSVIYADIAQGQFKLGNHSEGLSFARRALKSVRHTESNWGLRHLATLERALTGRRDQASQELLQEIAATRQDRSSSLS
ncbi:helix-turn-helix domain-containing protein [Sphaerisporangium corydalis]|uniref:Helix-turn-helix domain-containing protein n=1 Tax=Sphaerisporangium corydalis TaxID=1441875 RepID=A0ABV9EKK6_9ACTN|nr:helix-turn-helix transcriptional regulator [Sphaerisporangium corydalis]